MNLGVPLQVRCSSMVQAVDRNHTDCMKKLRNHMCKHSHSPTVFKDVSKALKNAGMANKTEIFNLLLGWCALHLVWERTAMLE
jgi:hypothetical protein